MLIVNWRGKYNGLHTFCVRSHAHVVISLNDAVVAESRGGYTVFVSNPRYTCAFTAPLRLEFKLYNCELGIGLPPYTLLKSAIENGRIASLGLFGADIESEKDIENIQMILNLGAKYDDQSTYFTIPISLKDVTLNVKVELEFSGIGRDLTIEGRRVVGVNTTHCQSKDNDRCFVVRTDKLRCLGLADFNLT